MNNKVILLEKPEGQSWTEQEVNALTNRSMVEVERLRAKPHRLTVMNRPLGKPIAEVLTNTSFTQREVDYRNRWA